MPKYKYAGTLEKKISLFKIRNRDWNLISIDTIAMIVNEDAFEVKCYFLEKLTS